MSPRHDEIDELLRRLGNEVELRRPALQQAGEQESTVPGASVDEFLELDQIMSGFGPSSASSMQDAV